MAISTGGHVSPSHTIARVVDPLNNQPTYKDHFAICSRGILNQMSLKTIFALLIAACLMTSSIVYLSDMEFVSPRRALTVTSLWNLTHQGRHAYFKLFGSSNTGQTTAGEEDLGQKVETLTFVNTTPSGFLTDPQHDPAEKRPFLKSISKNSSRSLITQANNNSSTPLTPEVLPNTTSMTFNTSLVGCKESPYVECFPPNLKPVKRKIFKISFLRRPPMFPRTLSMTNCKINQCVVDDKVTNETDMVVVDGVGLKDNFPMPRRGPHQLYALQVWESPEHTYSDFITNRSSPWNQRINIIMSHRLDGDGVFVYSRLKFKPTPLGQRPNYHEIAQKKTRTAVWIVSHCKTHSRRAEYVKEMQKYIDIDIFGKCGTPCAMKNTTCSAWAATYKFYLAFENSLCTDYVTEKFFKVFEPNVFVIPVVRGGADYDTHLPNFTYINAAHFKTPKDLALHLKHLAADLDAYSKYLEYKDLYQKEPNENIYCSMCKYVHTHKLPQASQFYHLTSWLGGEHCHKPTDL